MMKKSSDSTDIFRLKRPGTRVLVLSCTIILVVGRLQLCLDVTRYIVDRRYNNVLECTSHERSLLSKDGKRGRNKNKKKRSTKFMQGSPRRWRYEISKRGNSRSVMGPVMPRAHRACTDFTVILYDDENSGVDSRT